MHVNDQILTKYCFELSNKTLQIIKKITKLTIDLIKNNSCFSSLFFLTLLHIELKKITNNDKWNVQDNSLHDELLL